LPVLDLSQAAAALANRGFPVFRIKPRGKAPLAVGWQQEATDDADQVRLLWQRYPRANIGLACGHDLWVLDVDGECGHATLARLQAQHGELPTTVMSRTGSNSGHHLFFAGEGPPRNSVRRLPGLDVRVKGGAAVLPPSVHADGGRYRWMRGRSPWELEPAAAPGWLIEVLSPPPEPLRAIGPIDLSAVPTAYVVAALQGELDAVALAPAGQRNDTLNRAAFNLRRFIASGLLLERDVRDLLAGAAAAIGLDQREAEATIRSGLRARRGGR
jgi:hypothetical protein